MKNWQYGLLNKWSLSCHIERLIKYILIYNMNVCFYWNKKAFGFLKLKKWHINSCILYLKLSEMKVMKLKQYFDTVFYSVKIYSLPTEKFSIPHSWGILITTGFRLFFLKIGRGNVKNNFLYIFKFETTLYSTKKVFFKNVFHFKPILISFENEDIQIGIFVSLKLSLNFLRLRYN